MSRISINWREQLRSPLTAHLALAALLAVIVIVFGLRCAFDWSAASDRAADKIVARQTESRLLELENAPLRGLDQRLANSASQMQQFYSRRIPPNYSSIAARLGQLAVASSVHLTRVQYTQGKSTDELTEITMDAGISGTYPEIMHFLNRLERDQTFFVIRAMALTGQQGGQVNLRLRLSTWMRPADAVILGLPPTQPFGQKPSPEKEAN